MSNPWEEIRLEDYEKHMALDSVRQLQALNGIMKAQMEAYPVKTMMILGVAGGNGLEHADPGKYDRIYGVDINREYLQAAEELRKLPVLYFTGHCTSLPAYDIMKPILGEQLVYFGSGEEILARADLT